MTLSIRDLLALIGIFALALAAMRCGGLFASATLFFLLFFITMLRAIVSVVANDEQISARGFVILYCFTVSC